MIRSFKDLNNKSQIYPDPLIRTKLQKEFPNKTTDALNKALIITKNSYDLSCALLNSECKLDANRFDSSNEHQVDSDYVNIVLYKNGVLISDKFFDYSINKNKSILKNIKKGEIDSDLMGNENDGYVKLIDKSEEMYLIDNNNNNNNNNNKKPKEDKPKGFTLGEIKRMQKKDI